MKRQSIVRVLAVCFAPMLAGLWIATGAHAGGSWTAISLAVPAGRAADVVAATDKMMASEVGKQFPGRLFLQQAIADGANPATHTFVPIYKSAAAGEAWGTQLRASKAYQEFLTALAAIGPVTSSARYRILKSWGGISDADSIWMSFAFDVDKPADYVAAIDTFRASAMGKKAPSQAHLSAVVAAGMTPMSHLVTVGYASEAEMETWQLGLQGNADWQKLLDALEASAEFQGASMVRTVKVWGSASLESLVAP